MATELETQALEWLDYLCEGSLDLTADNVTMAQLIRQMLDARFQAALEGDET
jgi:hypothetical protein